MHETGIVKDLVRRVQTAAREAGATRVTAARIWLGALSQFSPEHLREHFDEEARGTALEGARLEIETSSDPMHIDAQHVIVQSVDLDV